MFKTLKKLNNLFKEAKTLIDKNNSIDKEVQLAQAKLSISNDSLKAELGIYITDVQKDIKAFDLLNNDRTFYGTKDHIIDFKSTTLLQQNTGFQLDPDQSVLVSKRSSFKQLSNFEATYDANNYIYTVTYPEAVIMNFLQYSFLDNEGNPILPSNIYFNGQISDILYETWMDKLQRNNLNKLFINSFYTSPRSVKTIQFRFKKDIDVPQTQLSFIRNNYDLNSTISYKIPFSSKKGFVVYKNSYENLVNIAYHYSLNGTDYLPINFTNQNGKETQLGKIILETTSASNGFLYLRMTRGKVTFVDNNTKLTEDTIVITGSKVRKDPISFKLELGSENVDKKSVSIITSSSAFDSFSKIIPDFFQKTTTGLIEIKKKYIQYVSSVSELQKLTLKNQNSISIFKDISPIIYYTDNNTIYLPKVFATDDLNFTYTRLNSQNIFEKSDYTPILFDVTLDTI